MPKSKKGRVIHDSFEQVGELGKDTAKGVGEAIGAFSPLNILDNLTRPTTNSEELVGEDKKEEKKENSHTPINIDVLKKKYEGEDKQKEQALRQKLFRMVREGDENELGKKKREEEEKKMIELQEEQRKKEEEKKQKEQQDIDNLPKGKVRRSIFSPRKKAQMQHTETKPAVGKS